MEKGQNRLKTVFFLTNAVLCVTLTKPLVTGGSFCSAKITTSVKSAPADSESIVLEFFLMYAIIETGGKQYKVSNGDVIYIEKLDVQAEETVKFDKVLAFCDDNGVQVGAPPSTFPSKARSLKTARARRSPFFHLQAQEKRKEKKWVTVSLTPRLRSFP